MLAEFHKAAWSRAKIVQSESRCLALSLSSEPGLSIADSRNAVVTLEDSSPFWASVCSFGKREVESRLVLFNTTGAQRGWYMRGWAFLAGYTLYKMPSGSRNICGLLDIAVACGVGWKEVSRLEWQISTSETQQNRVEATLWILIANMYEARHCAEGLECILIHSHNTLMRYYCYYPYFRIK